MTKEFPCLERDMVSILLLTATRKATPFLAVATTKGISFPTVFTILLMLVLQGQMLRAVRLMQCGTMKPSAIATY